MKNGFNVIVMIVLALYVISPIDLLPGPVDDVITLLVYILANRKNLMQALDTGNKRWLADADSIHEA